MRFEPYHLYRPRPRAWPRSRSSGGQVQANVQLSRPAAEKSLREVAQLEGTINATLFSFENKDKLDIGDHIFLAR
jgi:hypothetical protein